MTNHPEFVEENEAEASEDKAEEHMWPKLIFKDEWAERIYKDALRNIKSDILRSKLGK